MKTLLLISSLICLVSCEKRPVSTTMTVSASSRISIERIGTFEDDIAYNGVRGIYVIKDASTGAEYIGVSGIGISETGSHRSGKHSISDER